MKKLKYKSLKIYCLQPYYKLKKGGYALIILPGLPLSSKEFNFIRKNILLFNNLDIFYIIYPGYPQNTKEKFLEKNPAKLVDDFINHLKLRKKYKKVFVIGSSFGGSLVLYLKNADRRVSISPVIDWKNLFKGRKGYDYRTFKNFLEKSGYKISDQGWKLLKSGKMFLKLKSIDLKNQLFLVYSSNDPEIDVNNLEQLIKKFNLKAIKFSKKQHLSLRKLRKSIIKKILKWMFLDDNYIYLFNKKLKIVKNLVKKN
jgi:esterase/lipase